MKHAILSLGAWAGCALFFAGATACTATDVSSDPGTASEALDDASVSFVTVRADVRTCSSALCGGYFLQAVNRQGPERYATALDFTETGLSTDVIADLQKAPPGELVLRGHFEAQGPRARSQPFIVLDVYRGMPGVTASDASVFYQVHARKPAIQCVVAPCPNEIASRLNTTTEEAFDRADVGPAALPWVDREWLTASVYSEGAVVAGTLSQGDLLPGGYEEVLLAGQVFIHLPARTSPCPVKPGLLCSEGSVPAYERTPDRCLVQIACVTPGICPLIVPECAAGYTRISWPAAPNGCQTFACDPSFAGR
jgi:hypothetical protein